MDACFPQARCDANNLVNNEYAPSWDFVSTDPTRGSLAVDMYYNGTLARSSRALGPANRRLPAVMTAAVASWFRSLTGGREVACACGAGHRTGPGQKTVLLHKLGQQAHASCELHKSPS
jgi:hypothetical protein